MRRRFLPPLLLALALAVFALPGSAAATTWHVTSSDDAGNGVCEGVAAGDCTLRDAVLDADPDDTIVIDATFNPALTAEIPIDTDLTISGQGAAMTTVTGSGGSRVLNIGSTTPGVTVEISDLSITGGHAPGGTAAVGNGGSGGGGQDGGGILNAAILDLVDVTMSDNHAGDGAGGNSSSTNFVDGGSGGGGGSGGAVSNSGALTLTNSTLSGNHAGSGGGGGAGPPGAFGGTGGGGGSGGAISNSGGGTVQLTNTTLSGNAAGSAGGGGSGGVLSFTDGYDGGPGGSGGSGGAIASSTGTVTATGSTFATNQAGAGGRGGDGGSANFSGSGGAGGPGGSGGAASSGSALTLTNSTLNANLAGGGGDGGNAGAGFTTGNNGNGGSGGSGGAISNGALPADATQATVAGNQAGPGGSPGSTGGSGGSSGAAGSGGGIAGDLTLTNTLIASNTPDNCSGSPVDSGINLSYPAASGCPDDTATDPLLDPLAANGGPTMTMRIAPASAAIDAIPATGSNCPATDQRGITRPQGIECDIGAFESRAAVKPVITATNPASPGNTATPRVIGTSQAGTVSLHTDAACMTAPVGSGTEAAFASPGITVAVQPNSTTTLYASTTNADGTTPCSNGFTYTNSIPVPPPSNPVGGGSGTGGSGPTGQRAAALAKCKKKRGKARAKCKKKANQLPV